MPVNLRNEKALNQYIENLVYHGEKYEALKPVELQDKAFVEANKDKVISAMIYQWMKMRVREHLTESSEVPYLEPVTAADEKAGAELYCLTDEIMAAAGVPVYEVSNYARSGFECRHNLTYWTGGDYVGIGPAAHGRIGLVATCNPASVRAWLADGTEVERLTPAERQTEKLLMGLRLRRNYWHPAAGLSPKGMRQALAQGWIEQSGAGIRPTLAGTLMLNQLILLLMPE